MNKRLLLQSSITLLLTLSSTASFAWMRSLELGYGYSHDPNNVRYNNSGFLLESDVAPLHVDQYTHWSANLALGAWHSTAPFSNTLRTAAASLELRLYPATNTRDVPFYILGSVGPAYLSQTQFGTNFQGSHVTGQWIGGLGLEYQNFDVNFHLVHYSNANTVSPNDGINILYMLSMGYLFDC